MAGWEEFAKREVIFFTCGTGTTCAISDDLILLEETIFTLTHACAPKFEEWLCKHVFGRLNTASKGDSETDSDCSLIGCSRPSSSSNSVLGISH
jgi:hypothetical protein